MEGTPPPPRIVLPSGFPTELDDDELAHAQAQLIEATRRWSGPNIGRFKGEVLGAMLQIAIAEQARRDGRRSAAEARRAADSARATSRIALAIAVVATLIAAASGLLDYFGDQSWQDEQTEILSQIRDLVADIRDRLRAS